MTNAFIETIVVVDEGERAPKHNVDEFGIIKRFPYLHAHTTLDFDKSTCH